MFACRALAFQGVGPTILAACWRRAPSSACWPLGDAAWEETSAPAALVPGLAVSRSRLAPSASGWLKSVSILDGGQSADFVPCLRRASAPQRSRNRWGFGHLIDLESGRDDTMQTLPRKSRLRNHWTPAAAMLLVPLLALMGCAQTAGKRGVSGSKGVDRAFMKKVAQDPFPSAAQSGVPMP